MSESHKPLRDVVVIGGGLIGVCTAAKLASCGMFGSVVLVEEKSGAAMGTSYANAGRFVASLFPTYPLRSLSAVSTSGSKLGLPFSSIQEGINLLPWGLQFVRRSLPDKYKDTNAVFRAFAPMCIQNTHEMLHALKKIGFDSSSLHQYDDNLWLFSDPETAMKKRLAVGVDKTTSLDCKECAQTYPSMTSTLDRIGPTATCVLSHQDMSLDCRLFTRAVAKYAEKNGAKFKYNTKVVDLSVSDDNKAIVRVKGSEGEEVISADIAIVATGPWTPSFISSLRGVKWPRIPIVGLRGCSVELEGVTSESGAALPLSVTDYTSGALNLQITPLGSSRARIIAFAEPMGVNSNNFLQEKGAREEQHQQLLQGSKDHFKGISWTKSSPIWTGLRPITPDFLPLIGRISKDSPIVVNVGHGATGWTMAAASAHILVRSLTSTKEEQSEEERVVLNGVSPLRFSLLKSLY